MANLINAANGGISATYEYGPFGELIRATGMIAKDHPIRFSTKYQDEETDLIYYGYRYYSVPYGRWPNRDPIEEMGGFNLYGMVDNDPIGKVDLLGFFAFDFFKQGRCNRAIDKWAKDCRESFPNCDDDIWDSEDGFLRVECLERRHELIGECTSKSKDMFKKCMSACKYTPPVKFPWQELIEQFKKKPYLLGNL